MPRALRKDALTLSFAVSDVSMTLTSEQATKEEEKTTLVYPRVPRRRSCSITALVGQLVQKAVGQIHLDLMVGCPWL